MTRKVAILTLTRFPDIFYRLAESISKYEPFEVRRVVVTSGGAKVYPQVSDDTRRWEVVEGVEPFVFARNVNRGLAHIGPGWDVLLVNDDCEWTYASMTDLLGAMCARDETIGLLAPVVDGGVGNPEQRMGTVPLPYLLDSQFPVCFVCVYLPAHTLELVGPMDERFTGYGGDDIDYNERVLAAGLRCCITNRASIVHGFGASVPFSASFKRLMTEQQQRDSMKAMDLLVQEKHAQHVAVIVPSYPVPRFIGFEWSMGALQLPPGSVRLRPPGKSTAQNKNDGIKAAPAHTTHYFLVDDDHYFANDLVTRLLKHRKPVVCALTVTSSPPCLPVMFKRMNPVDGALWYTWDDMNRATTQLVEVDAGPGSGILISKDVMQRIEPPWFEYGLFKSDEQAEDMGFWQKVKHLTDPRVPIYVDTGARMGHYDTVAAMPERDDSGRWRIRFTWPNGTSVVIDPTQKEQP